MTKEQLAQKLNGREYPIRLTKQELAEVKAAGLVIVTGASDELMEFEGAICDEVDAPGVACIKDGKVLAEHDGCECHYCGYAAVREPSHTIESLWCVDDISWTFTTDIPHADFDVMEDGEVYCRGLVFSVGDL